MEENNGEPADGGRVDLSTKKEKKDEQSETVSPSKDVTLECTENPKERKHHPKSKKRFKDSKILGVKKTSKSGKFTSLGATVKKLWDVWGRFKVKNTDEPSKLSKWSPTIGFGQKLSKEDPSVSEKTLGVPGFEEIACIEAEVPDIMLMDKDRVRTSCKECMKDPPTFPTKEQVKAKLIAVDEYYGVNSPKTKPVQSAAMEHDADYYDVDGSIVRPSWRFILERPLVEQYVLMTNYIRKVSVLSEMKEPKPLLKLKEDDSGNDPEYKKFEQKFIRERRELLAKMQKPKTQDMAVQASIQLEESPIDQSVSEISLYPESEESTNSQEPSAVTIVTSRDYSSPLPSDFDGRTTDKSTSYHQGSWWKPQSTSQISEPIQTSCNSSNKNTSSGTDGQSIPVHSTWCETKLQPASSDSQCIEAATNRKPKQKTVSFSPAVTYYQSPGKNAAVGNPPEDHNEQRQEVQEEQSTTPDKGTVNSPENIAPLQQLNQKLKLDNLLQATKHNQIVSVSMPAEWKKIICNEQPINVAVSRHPGVKHPAWNVSFQKYEEIPDVVHSDPNVSTFDRSDANIQTQTSILQKRLRTDKLKHIRDKEVELQCSERAEQVETEGRGTGTHIQSVLPTIVSVRRKSQCPRTEQTIGCRMTPGNPKRSDPAVQPTSFPTSHIDIQAPSSNVDGNANPSTHPHSKQISDIPPHPHDPHEIKGTSQKPQHQQQSTDTEGSSTSNEHLRLKASPACFFKVATPTDLSRISVDDFYPDVPEIDAEVSHTSEPKSSSPSGDLNPSTTRHGIKSIEERNLNEEYNSPIKRKTQIKDASQQSIITQSQGEKSKVSTKMQIDMKKHSIPILKDGEKNLALQQPKIPPFAIVDANVSMLPKNVVSSAGSSNERTTNDVVAIQRLKENLVDPGIQLPQGRTSVYVRTLSSLVEETSSVVDTNSTQEQEKLADMPAVSIGELKTIFEKKSGVSQGLEECSDPKKMAAEKLELDGKFHVAMAPRKDCNKIEIITHTGTEAEEGVKLVSNVIDTTKHSTTKDNQSVKSRSGNETTRNAHAMINEECSVPLMSEIDVIKPSEIYSNMSMYFSTSEDRMAKLNKARAVFQPITFDDDLESCSSGGEKPQPKCKVDQGSSKKMVRDEKHKERKQMAELKLKSNREGDNPTVGLDTKQKLGEETEKFPTNEDSSCKVDQPSDPIKTKSKIHNTSTPETKHWLMDAVPVLSRNTRFHGLRPHKPVCVKVTEAEAVKFRQEAVKPVFKFLKRLREIDDKK